MNGEKFERIVAQDLKDNGFEVSLTPKTNDRGIDIVAKKGTKRIAIQAKGYSKKNKVGSSAVQKASGLLSRPDIDQVMVVTSSSFTSEAQAVANNRGVELLTTDLSGTTSRPEGSNRTKTNDDFIDDPRVRAHQNKAGVSPYDEEAVKEESTTDVFNTTTLCENCRSEISGGKQDHIDHWQQCELPDDRPTRIPVDSWWEIKEAVE